MTETYENITGVQFYVMGDRDTEISSIMEVKNKDSVEIEDFGSPKVAVNDGIYDSRMGYFNRNDCTTCQGADKCPGHFGMIRLNYPVYSPMFIKYIVKWLNVICWQCYNPIIGYIDLYEKYDRLVEYKSNLSKKKYAKYKKCACGAEFRSYSVHKTIKFRLVYSSETEDTRIIMPHTVMDIFSKINDETIRYFAEPTHPVKFVRKILPMPPNTMRPFEKKDINDKDHFIVKCLHDIIEKNLSLSNFNKDNAYDPTMIAKLESINEIYYNHLKGKKTENTDQKQNQSISTKITGKEGRIRMNLMGKRVDGAGRNVIRCDNNIPQDYVGLNMYTCMIITRTERVCVYNFNRLFAAFQNGSMQHPGCSYILKKGTTRKVNIEKYKRENKEAKLELGDILYLHHTKGDIAIMNREPSLDTSSLTSMRIQLVNGYSVGLNVGACALFAADFDGDQMTFHRVNHPMSRAEAEITNSVAQGFISSEHCSPRISQQQDTIINGAEITFHGVIIRRVNVMRIFNKTSTKIEIPDQEYFTGREVISLLIKSNYKILNYYKAKSTFSGSPMQRHIKLHETEKDVVIKNGELVRGILDKTILASKQKHNLFQTIFNIYGPNEAIRASNDIQSILLQYGSHLAISIGFRDMYVRPAILLKIQDIISGILASSKKITVDYYHGKMSAPIGTSSLQEYERIQNNLLKQEGIDVIDDIIFGNLDLRMNVLFKEVATGAKGSMDNFKVICSAIGQLLFRGIRFPENYNGRTTPYHTRYDMDPRARGYVANNYSTGLTPVAFLFHSIESRTAIVTRSVTTAEAGVSGRRTIKNIEGLYIDNLHRTVRDGMIVELLYGGDGMDPRYNNPAVITIADPNIDYKTLHDRLLKVPEEAMAEAEKQYETIKAMRDKLLKINITCSYNLGITLTHNILVPYNIDAHPRSGEPMDPKELIESASLLNEFIERLPRIYYGPYYTGPILECHKKAVTYFAAHLMSIFNMAELHAGKWSALDFKTVLEYINFSLKRSMISYGLAIGALCSQGLSNPITQFVIDAHHRSGVGGDNRSLGRIKEIMQVKHEVSHTMHIALKEPYSKDESMAVTFANKIRSVTVADFLIDASGLIFGKFGDITIPKYKSDNEYLIAYSIEIKAPPKDITNKCFRLTLDLESIVKLQININEIISSIEAVQHVYPVYLIREMSLIIYVYLTAKTNVDINKPAMVKAMLNSIIDTKIRGITNIISVIIKKRKRYSIEESGKVLSWDEHIIETIGSNLIEILELDEVNPDFTTTTNIEEITDIYGIEMARCRHIVMYTEQLGESINFRHYNLIANEISTMGELSGITNKGAVTRGSSSIMQSMSDEKPVQTLVKSAIDELTDNMKSVSPNVMMCQYPKIGTNYNDFKLDLEYCKKSETVDDLFNDFV